MGAAAAAASAPNRAEPRTPFGALEHLLDDLAAVLFHTTSEIYVATPMAGVSGSIGEHVRHTLDHICAFAAASPSAALSYDRRQRGTPVETDPGAALRQVFRLKAALAQRSARDLDQPVRVTSMISTTSEPLDGWSTIARELAFVVSHTVHHHAIIALLLSFQGLATPERFGYAPSTPRA